LQLFNGYVKKDGRPQMKVKSKVGLERYQKSYPIPNTIGSCRCQYPIPIPAPGPLPSEALYWFNVLIFLQTPGYVNAMASKNIQCLMH